MKQIITTLFFIFFIITAHAQYYNQTSQFLNYNKVWAWGHHAGFNFNDHSGFYSSAYSDEGAASVSDPVTGQLLFYSDGASCWNRNNQPMSQANGSLLGNSLVGTTAQGVCIVPFVNDPKKFYLFSLEPQGGYALTSSRGRLYYSVVDMTLSNGLGNIIPSQKNIRLDSLLGEAMIAVPGRNCDVWLMVHSVDSAVFKAYHITAAGIDPVPVRSVTGQQISGDVTYLQTSFGPPYAVKVGAYMQCQLAVSPNRQKIAITSQAPQHGPLVTYSGLTQGSMVCDFDAGTGAVSNAQVLDTVGCYGVAFSPDNTKLYITNNEDVPPVFNSLQQYDITNFNAAAILATRQIIHTFNVPGGKGLKLYNDTLYTAIGAPGNATPNMHRVNKPNLAGTACNFQANAVALNGNGACVYMLPNDVAGALPPDTLHDLLLDTVICTAWTDDIVLQAPAGYTGYVWNDGSTGTSLTAGARGIYWVLSEDACHSRLDTFKIGGIDMAFDLGNDTIACNTASLRLEAGISDAQYLWQDGSTEQYLYAGQTDTYRVSVTKLGCTVSDSIHVTFVNLGQRLGKDTLACTDVPLALQLQANAPQGSTIQWSTGETSPQITVTDSGIYKVTVSQLGCSGYGAIRVGYQQCECPYLIPNAFTPNGDGSNDVFLPQWPQGCPIEGFSMHIYNRWGQMVYTSEDSHRGWDGQWKGAPADIGTYFYEIRFYGGSRRTFRQRKGDFTLIR